MNPKSVELKACIWSQISNYEELLQPITSLQASHAWVFKRMDVVVHEHAIPSIGTLTEVKKKNQVWLEMDTYFDELMCIAIKIDLVINTDTMHQYVAGLATLKMMMHMISDELDKGAKWAYPDETEARICFQKYVTTKYMDTITNYQDLHQFATIDLHEDVEELVFTQLVES